MMEKQTLSEPTTAHRLHCIGCGAEIAGAEAAEDFRCRECGNLFAVEYPELLLRDSSRDGNSRTLPTNYIGGMADWPHPSQTMRRMGTQIRSCGRKLERTLAGAARFRASRWIAVGYGDFASCCRLWRMSATW